MCPQCPGWGPLLVWGTGVGAEEQSLTHARWRSQLLIPLLWPEEELCLVFGASSVTPYSFSHSKALAEPYILVSSGCRNCQL